MKWWYEQGRATEQSHVEADLPIIPFLERSKSRSRGLPPPPPSRSSCALPVHIISIKAPPAMATIDKDGNSGVDVASSPSPSVGADEMTLLKTPTSLQGARSEALEQLNDALSQTYPYGKPRYSVFQRDSPHRMSGSVSFSPAAPGSDRNEGVLESPRTQRISKLASATKGADEGRV